MLEGLDQLRALLEGDESDRGALKRGDKIMKITIEGWEDEPRVIENVDEFFMVFADMEGRKAAMGAAGPRILLLAAMEAIKRYR